MRVMFIAIAFAGITGTTANADPSGKPADQNVATPKLQLVRLSCGLEDEKAVLTTLNLANKLVQQGDEVVLFTDSKSAAIGDRTLRHLPEKLRDKVKRSLDTFIQGGGKLLVCPHCARRYDLTAPTLRQGATMTTSEQLHKLEEKADRIYEYKEPPQEAEPDPNSRVNQMSPNQVQGV